MLFVGRPQQVPYRTSATNAAKVYETHRSDPKVQPPATWPNFSLRTEHVWDGVITLWLLEDYAARNVALRVPHGGDQKDRFTAAIKERNARMEQSGQPEWAHYCTKCVRYFPGRAGGPASTFYICFLMPVYY
jgi:hypothetical protein